MGKLRVGVLFGGRSSEHEISLRSALTIIRAIDPERYEVVPIGVARDGRWFLYRDAERTLTEITSRFGEVEPTDTEAMLLPYPLSTGKLWTCRHNTLSDALEILSVQRIDVVFPVLHGTYGEDGTIQGLLDLAGLPYVGSGVFGSAVGMHKEAQKRILRDAGLPVTEFAALCASEFENNPNCAFEIVEQFGLPVYVKPNALGSSVGVSRVENRAELETALVKAFRYDRKVLIEAACEGHELECAVLGNETPQVSTVGEIIVSKAHRFYSYESKYLDPEGARIEIPARLPQSVIDYIRTLAAKAFKALDLRGMARIDLLSRHDFSKIVINEVNTIPGFTSISMYPKLWEACGLNLPQLLDRLIELALEEHAMRNALIYCYDAKPRHE